MFIDKGINQKALLNFVKKYKEIGYLQQFAIVHNGDVKIKFAVEPYKEEDIKQLFSLSKTFTSMAIGRAVDEGRLKLDEKVIDIFPFFAPANPSEYMKKMTVYNLLTMNTGHESCVMPKIGMGGNPIKNFMELDIPYEPGTHFAYNSGASLLLSAIINVRCGMSLDKYLEPLYEALNIKNHYYEEIDGISLGAAGLHVNIDALIEFGKFLSNEGMVNGKQIISKEYVRLATSKCVESDPNSTIDWTQGYGLHLWMGKEGYRCDGAY
jgi:CubicO group peptidase (beta-lactamase class C family)